MKRLLAKTARITVACVVALLAGGASGAEQATWRHQMKLVDYMGVYDFPEELVSFPFTCPPNTVQKERLKLLGPDNESPLEYQLSDVVESGGYLTGATIRFRSDLPRNGSRVFRLVHDPAYTAGFAPHVALTAEADGTAVLGANLQQLRVPADGASPSASAPPILGISRDGGKTWIGGGSLLLPKGIAVEGLHAEVVDQGPLAIKYRLRYAFTGDRTWQVDLAVQHNEKHVLVDEATSGFTPQDGAFWKLSYQKGLEPDGRLVMCNGGYNAGPRGQYCGAYDRDLRADGALPYQLGLYTANSYGVMRSTVFFNDNGSNALIFAVNRPRDWKTPARRVWSANNAPENIYFYRSGGDSYARLALLGRERHWALSVIPRDEVVISELPVSPADQPTRKKSTPRQYDVRKDLEGYPADGRGQFGAGPEVRLWQRLADFNLNAYKDMVFDFDEPLTPYDPQGEKCSFDDYWMKGVRGGHVRGPIYQLVQRYWDVSGGLQQGWEYFRLYANSRADWTPDERRRMRSILIFIAHFVAGDSYQPHTSMMAGQPNFVVMAMPVLPLAAAIFPDHPRATQWKSAFMRFWNEWLDVYTRRANPRLNTCGGRWMENVACYWTASLKDASSAADAMMHCDGSQLFAHPLFKDLVRWTLDGLAPSEESCRRLVPIGAHARGDVEAERIRMAADLLAKSDPALAGQLLWCLTDGREGARPELRSRLYTDYGAVLWHDFGGPHEAFLTIQQLNGSGYRWTPESNGALYYATKGHRWSWNGAEQNGDSFDINRLPLFNLDGKSLGAHAVDGVLYDFDFAQFYKAAGSNPAYPWRGVMMLRDDYLAVYDHVADPKAVGRFQWCNYEAFLQAEYFGRPDFTDLKATCVPRFRGEGGPLHRDWGDAPPLESMRPGPFSVRWTGMLMDDRWAGMPPTAGDYTIVAEVNPGDEARIWLNRRLVYDSATGKSVQVRLGDREYADLKVEFVHHSGPARISVKWGTDRLVPPHPQDTFHRLPMPQLYAVKAGPGDQLHVVAPKPHRVEARPYGALIDGKEYVFCSAADVQASDGPAVFSGTAGYARENQVALFEGAKVGFQGLMIERLSGDFGISASRQADGTITGRIAGRKGGTVQLTPPAGFDIARCHVEIHGAAAPHRVEGRAIRFDVPIVQADGCKSYTVSAGR